MKYTKFRAVLSQYDPNDFPKTTTIKGFICNDKDEVKARSMSMIKDLFDSRFTTNICPGMGYDPRFYELDTNDPNMTPIIWYKHPAGDDRYPVFNATWVPVECTFSNTTNFIEYRAMRITMYQDKWYISSKFNHQIIGIIENKTSINDICDAADKVWKNIGIDFSQPTAVLSDN